MDAADNPLNMLAVRPDEVAAVRAMTDSQRRAAIYRLGDDAVGVAFVSAVDAVLGDDPQAAFALVSTRWAAPAQKQWWSKYEGKFHPANDYPLRYEFVEEIKDDIEANGLKHPIVLHPDGRVLDGRARFIACEMLGIEPRFVQWNGTPGTEGDYLDSVNDHRRHLSKWDRAIRAARRAQGYETEAKRRSIANLNHGDANVPQSLGRSIDRAALAWDVSRNLAGYAKTVIEKCPPDVVAALSIAINDGVVRPNDAAIFARMDRAYQIDAIRGGSAVIREKIRHLKKEEKRLLARIVPGDLRVNDLFAAIEIPQVFAAVQDPNKALLVIVDYVNRHAAQYLALAEAVTVTMARTDRNKVPESIRNKLLNVLLEAAAKVAGRTLDDEDFKDSARAALAKPVGL